MNFNASYNLISTAIRPENIFGSSPQEIQKVYKNLAKILHPDRNGSSPESTEAFAKLTEWLFKAEEKVKAGTYGSKTLVTIKSKMDEYEISDLLASGDISEVYQATGKKGKSVTIKVLRNPSNKDLFLNEYKNLIYLHKEGSTKGLKVTRDHLPKIVEQVEVDFSGTRKLVTVLEYLPDYYSLSQVQKTYPKGIEIKSAAWMFNRILGALMAAHQTGIIHGAITPDHILIQPETHNAVLLDWSYSVKSGQKIKAISSRWKDFYPLEVTGKLSATPGTDTYMLARSILYVMGADFKRKNLPDLALPPKLHGFFKACFLGPKHRPSDVFELFEDLKQILKELYGKPKFIPFKMK